LLRKPLDHPPRLSSPQDERRDTRLPATLLHVALGVLSLYWVWFVVRCGEDECIDRPVVSAVIAGFWFGGGVMVAGARQSQTALRWAGATLWLVTAVLFLLVLRFIGFDIAFRQ
jgi:hypothetical protein